MADREARIREQIKALDRIYCYGDLTPDERQLWFDLRNIKKEIKTKRFWIALAKKNNEPFEDIQVLIDEALDEGMKLIIQGELSAKC